MGGRGGLLEKMATGNLWLQPNVLLSMKDIYIYIYIYIYTHTHTDILGSESTTLISQKFAILCFFHQSTQYSLITMAGKNIALGDVI